MILLDEEIVSPLLIETINQLHVPVFKKQNTQEAIGGMSKEEFLSQINENKKILTNSESCLSWLETYAPDSEQNRWSKQLKDKGMFRQLLSKMYPDYFYTVIQLDELENMTPEDIPFPVVIKPAKGYSSVGVHKIKTKDQWKSSIDRFMSDLLMAKNIYGKEVVDGESILIEKWIHGDEYAVDGYYDSNGNPVILNIFKHLYKDEYDTSDRIYFTSRKMIREVLNDMYLFMEKFKEIFPVKNFPIHFEVRKHHDSIVPIEMNPLRFAGAGTTDLGYYAYQTNGYKHYFEETIPDWEAILDSQDENIYGFCCAEVPIDVSLNFIESIDHESFKEQFTTILDYREIHAANDRTFAIVFFKSENMKELDHLLKMDLRPYIKLKDVKSAKLLNK